MVVCVPVTDDGMIDPRWGRAARVAIADVQAGAVASWREFDVRWDEKHDLGTEGWDKPFALDVTKELKWGQKNQITVRVYDSAYAGGIWKPVKLEVLK